MMDQQVPIPISLCRPGAVLPRLVHEGDAGMDVCAAETCILQPGETRAIPLGFKVALPQGYELQVRARSGISLKTRLRLPNGVGTIDAGYRGEMAVLMHNSSQLGDPNWSDEILTLQDARNRAGVYRIEAGERIAQLVLARVPVARWEVVESVDELGQDRGGGFGHSGV